MEEIITYIVLIAIPFFLAIIYIISDKKENNNNKIQKNCSKCGTTIYKESRCCPNCKQEFESKENENSKKNIEITRDCITEEERNRRLKEILERNESVIYCGYCNYIIKEDIMKCPSCNCMLISKKDFSLFLSTEGLNFETKKAFFSSMRIELGFDWRENAFYDSIELLKKYNLSKRSLIEDLHLRKFDDLEIEYAIKKMNLNWAEIAIKEITKYNERFIKPLSLEDAKELLLREGFEKEEVAYAIEKIYNSK